MAGAFGFSEGIWRSYSPWLFVPAGYWLNDLNSGLDVLFRKGVFVPTVETFGGMFGTMSGANGVRPRWAQMLPAFLKPLGYRSYHSGKWHMDGDRLPAGFDHSYSLEDPNRFFSPQSHFEDDVQLPPVDPGSGYYSTRFIADHAIKCLKEHAGKFPDKPFFEYLAFTATAFSF